ncbi:MAG: ADOP family duplicated permease [Gemmatimonadales bacterium]
MERVRTFAARFRGLLGGNRADRALDAEIRLHLELETEKNLALGLSPAEARRQARLAFGAVEAMKEEHRDGRGIGWITGALADVRYAVRGLARHPAVGVAAILTLAIAVGANTAIYSAVNAVMLRPLPFHDPSRLVMLWEENPERGWHLNVVAPANYLDWKAETPAFADAAAYFAYPNSQTLTGGGEPRVLTTSSVTGNFFSVLGLRAELGRGFTADETWDNGSHGVVISDRLWRTQFAADRAIIGRTVELNARPHQIIGVMPPEVRFPEADTDIWTSFSWPPAQRNQVSFRRAHYIRAIARLKPGVSLDQANAALQVVVKRLQRDYPVTNTLMGAGMTPLHAFLVGDTRVPLLVLLAAVGLLLLIACANIGNLLLVQAGGRSREAALRLALGASRPRLIRQALAESAVLAVTGGIVGLALGWWGTHVLGALQPGILPVSSVSVSWNVVGYVVAITTLSAMLFSVAPMLWTGRRAPAEALKSGGRGGDATHWMRRWRRALVVAEVALALVLTLAAGLLVRSYRQLAEVNPGFDPDGVLAIAMNVPGARYDNAAKISGFYDALVRRVAALPDVESAAVVSSLPLTGGVGWTSDFTAEGRAPDAYGVDVAHRELSPDYFRTMRVPILKGRDFTPDDHLNGEQVVLINRALAESYFRGEDPIGRRITFDRVPDSSSTWRTIVGVVGDERQAALATASKIEFITPQDQAPSTFMNLMVRTRRDPVSLVPAIRHVVHEMDQGIAFTSAQSMDEVRDQSLATARFLMVLLFGFAAAGLLLAAIGVYGVMAHLARTRVREMGIRIALGAAASNVRWLVVREGLQLSAVGLIIGLGVGSVANHAIRALLYHVTPGDTVTVVAVSAVLMTTAVVATWLPAARASRADPMESLRSE